MSFKIGEDAFGSLDIVSTLVVYPHGLINSHGSNQLDLDLQLL